MSRGSAMVRIDFTRALRELYTAGPDVAEVHGGRGIFLFVDGMGAPASPAFARGSALLEAAADAARRLLRRQHRLDFTSPIECLWFVLEPDRLAQDRWQWRQLLRVPEVLGREALRELRAELLDRKLDGSAVERLSWKEGRALQLLHVGPREALSRAHHHLVETARRLQLTPIGPMHEIFLGDPLRTLAARCRTIVRVPVRDHA